MATGVNELPLPSFGVRLLATMLDLVVLSALGTIVFRILHLTPVWIPQQVIPSFDSWSSIVAVLLLWSYTVGLTLRFGGTLGKMAFGLRVVSEDGTALDLVTVIVREIVGKFVSVMTLGLGFLWIAWDHRKQGFHDKMAKTLVVYQTTSN
jgi:uncharacterized RDD family membrane protein YckC